jgi:HPt (histidine-containing phosphotransfer) domain-containing protein
LYLEANEGTASGGHSALQLADQIYHYQHVDSGYIRLIKQDATSFYYSYRFLQNRSLHSSRIEVSDETLNLLKDHFSQIYANQEFLFKDLANLQKDRLFLQQLLHEQPIDTVLQMRGLGLFKANRTPIANQTLQHLQALIKKTYGNDFLTERFEQLNKAITTLIPSDWSKPLATPIYTMAEHYQDLQTARHALQLLQQDVVADTITLNEPLTPSDTQRLENFQHQLQNNILSLLHSNRPDWGYALLINVARLMAVDASLTAQQWIFIDDFADNSKWVQAEQIPDLAAQLQLAKQYWLAAKSNTGFSEMDYSRLEMTANHYAELGKSELRYTGEQALPDKPVPLIIDSLPNLSITVLKQALANLSHYEIRLQQQLDHHNHYDLLTHNCVTELFRTIDDAILNSPALA